MKHYRFVLLSLLLVVASRSYAVEGWTSPSGFVDIENKWGDEAKSYDGITTTYARDVSNRLGDGGILELSFSTPVYTDRLRVNSDFGFGIVDSIQIDVLYQGDAAYTTVHNGGVTNATWTEISIPTGVIEKIHYRFHYILTGYQFWIYEISAYALPAQATNPVPQTDAATSVNQATAVTHGTLTDDGGIPCEMRFEYGLDTSYGSTTAWQSGFATGDKINEVLSGLSNNTTYHYRVQARQGTAGAVISGADQTFSTAGIPTDGSVVWVSPIAVSDPDSKWIDENNAIDDDPVTSAKYFQDLTDPLDWGGYLHFTANIAANGIKLLARDDDYIDMVDIDVLRDGAWADVYEGAYEDAVDEIYPFDKGTVTEVRVRLHVNKLVGEYLHVFELDLHHGANTITITSPSSSQVSPAWVEGEFWADTQTVEFKVDGVVRNTKKVGRVGWYAGAVSSGPTGVPLSTTSTTQVEASAMSGTTVVQTATQTITWTPTDLAGKTSSEILTMRQNCSLLLTASGTGTTLTIDADGDGTTDFTGAPGDKFAFQYSTAGAFVARASIDGVSVGSMTVHAVAITFPGAISCVVGITRQKDVPVTPAAAGDQLKFMPSDHSQVVIETESAIAIGARVEFYPRYIDPAGLLVRLGGDTGPIIGEATLNSSTLTFVERKNLPVIKTFADGDMLIGSAIGLEPRRDDIQLRLWVGSGGTVFEESGTNEYWAQGADFDLNNQLNYFLIRSTTGKICHKANLVKDAQ